MKALLLFAILLVASVYASGRAELAQQRHEEGTDAHGHNVGIPYYQIVGYVLNKDGTVPYEYRYTTDKHGHRTFNDSAYDDIRQLIGCSVTREELNDLTDLFFDLNHNHILDPWELQHVLDCLGGLAKQLAKQFHVHPTRMMDDCSVDGIPGVSSSDYILSETCLPSCTERQAAKHFVFASLIKGTCRVDPSRKHRITEVFGDDWEKEIGGKENLQPLIDMYQLAPLE